MTPLFKKRPVLDERLKRIEKELSLVDSDIQALSKTVTKADGPTGFVRLRSATRQRDSDAAPGRERKGSLPSPEAGTSDMESDGSAAETVGDGPSPGARELGEAPNSEIQAETRRRESARQSSIRDERFSDYLASSFQQVGPLRHERRIQRNKAILMVVLVLLVLFWVLYQWLL